MPSEAVTVKSYPSAFLSSCQILTVLFNGFFLFFFLDEGGGGGEIVTDAYVSGP